MANTKRGQGGARKGRQQASEYKNTLGDFYFKGYLPVVAPDGAKAGTVLFWAPSQEFKATLPSGKDSHHETLQEALAVLGNGCRVKEGKGGSLSVYRIADNADEKDEYVARVRVNVLKFLAEGMKDKHTTGEEAWGSSIPEALAGIGIILEANDKAAKAWAAQPPEVHKERKDANGLMTPFQYTLATIGIAILLGIVVLVVKCSS